MIQVDDYRLSLSGQDTIHDLVCLQFHYYKNYWCYEIKAYKKIKGGDLVIKLVSSGAIGAGVTAGGITLNPVIIGVL